VQQTAESEATIRGIDGDFQKVDSSGYRITLNDRGGLPEQTRLDALAQTGGLTGFRTFDRSARDFAELFEGGFEVFDDFRGEDGRSGRLSDSSRLSSFSQKMSGPGKKPPTLLLAFVFVSRRAGCLHGVSNC
jgi:hypothetical protein